MAGEPITALTPGPTQTIVAPLTLPSPYPSAPTWDVIELLPVGTPQERLRLLRQHSRDLHAITVPHADVQAAAAARTNAENTLKRLLAPAAEGGFKLHEGDSRVIVAERALEKAEAEFRRLQERQQSRAASWQSASAALAACEDWLKNGRPSGVVLEAVEVDVPKPAKGESLLDQIENHRRRARELKAAKHTIESAPFPSSFAKQRAREMVEQLVARGAPDVSLLVEMDRAIEWPTMRVQSEVFNAQPGAVGFAEMPDVVGLFAWLHRDALVAALDREIVEASDDKAALTHEQRQLRTDELQRDLLAVERTEAALVWRAVAEQLPVWFRADISPLAVLGIELRTVPRAIDGPTTSPFAYDLVRPSGGRR